MHKAREGEERRGGRGRGAAGYFRGRFGNVASRGGGEERKAEKGRGRKKGEGQGQEKGRLAGWRATEVLLPVSSGEVVV